MESSCYVMLWHVRCIICPLKMQQRLIGDWWLKPRTILRALRIFLFVSFYGCLWDKSVDLSIEVNVLFQSLFWWHKSNLKTIHNGKSMLVIKLPLTSFFFGLWFALLRNKNSSLLLLEAKKTNSSCRIKLELFTISFIRILKPVRKSFLCKLGHCTEEDLKGK